MTDPAALASALKFIERGWSPIPVPHRSKAPVIAGWPNLRLDTVTAPAHFNAEPCNIGILLGEPSVDLIDIDLDAPEAVALGDWVLPETESMFGRAGKPRSHRLYRVTAPIRTKKFADPLRDGPNAMLVELRSTGSQTVFPPSTHESGEPIEWIIDGEPACLAREELLSAVAELAVAALVRRYAGEKGDDMLGKEPAEWCAALDVIDPRLGKRAREWLTGGIAAANLLAPPDWMKTLFAGQVNAALGSIPSVGSVPYSIGEARKLVTALSFLKDAARIYDTWCQYGLAIHRLGWGENGLKIWDAWSKTAENYDAAACSEKWASFATAAVPVDPKTVASIYYDAREAGWELPAPPSNSAGDRREWLAGSPIVGTVPTLDPGAPMASAREFVERRFQNGSVRTLHHHIGVFYAWNGTHYSEADGSALRAEIYHFLERAQRPIKEGAVAPFDPKRSKVADVLEALAAVAYLPPGIQTPAWLGTPNSPPAAEIIACKNGLLHLPTRAILPHTPAFLTQNALDFDFDPHASAPDELLRFLATLWDGEGANELIDTLQEIFGYCLSTDTQQQKIFLIIGPPRSGKGTIARLLTRLIGASNVVGPTLASLGQNFGLAPLIGKRVAIISDARLGSRADQQVIVERLLAISGEDALTIDRKFRDAWTGRLGARFVVLSNELPRLADSSGALASRFIVLVMTRSFLGHEDHGLERRLAAELPGILNWSIGGWERLQRRGHFIKPIASAEAVCDLEDLGSPIGAFVRECCLLGASFEVEIAQLFGAYQLWCKTQGRDHPGTVQTFARDLRAAVPGLKIASHRKEEGRKRSYQGLRLQEPERVGTHSAAM